MNLSDPDLELIDPTPNVHMLFVHFDQVFFWTKLASRAVVRWSKRMYSCAGTCTYNRGLCDIALSEPLLKLRPRKDLVETLLHEMIHAYLFVVNKDQDRDGHGPNFKEHMHRINKTAGLNISIYHDFHDEVAVYKTHWWRCNGPCHTRKPHFGIVRRSSNRAPGPTDYWWKDHQHKCGGKFIKIKEPENYGKGKKKHTPPQPIGDITKYINSTTNNNNDKTSTLPVLKDSNYVPVKSNLITKSNNSSTIIVTKRNNVVYNPQAAGTSGAFSGKGHSISDKSSAIAANVVETVRNVWANKTLPADTAVKKQIPKRTSITTIAANTSKHKAGDRISSPPSKILKIDDYFKSTATSILKDLYGKEFEIKETNINNKRLSVIPVNTDLVDCPVCSNKISSNEVNRHLDECLNKDIIESITNDNDVKTVINIKPETDSSLKQTDHNANVYIKNENGHESGTAKIKTEPNSSGSIDNFLNKNEQKCPCCDRAIMGAINEHLDECLAFFDNDETIPVVGASTSLVDTIVIDDDDDIFDETLSLNATGTKSPCPCCLQMIEQEAMNEHLDLCLS